MARYRPAGGASHPARGAASCFLAASLAFLGFPTDTAASDPVVIGEHIRTVVLETPHPYPGSTGSEPVWSDHYRYPGATYLVFEFKVFDLAPGDRVEVSDPQRKQVQVYSAERYRDREGGFITRMIAGPEAVIELYSVNPEQDHYGYRIERITRGYGDLELLEQGVAPEAICGAEDQQDAVCYQNTFPEVYAHGRPVARILMDGAALCTAWLVSCESHLITNNHCTWDDGSFDTQAELDRMEFQFMAEDATCGGNDPSVEYSFIGGTWLENDYYLDYTLIQAPEGEDPASVYGWLAIDDRLPEIDEPIYIVGHVGGRPKEISLFSTDPSDQDNPDGFCEVYSQDEAPCIGGTVPEIGYFCDTYGGSSGSPVLSLATHRVVALHHCPSCPNRGVRIQNIWARNQIGSHPLPACSLVGEAGSIELDRARYGCADSIGIQVIDASLQGAGSSSVTLWSNSESSPETAWLTESPAGSGMFAGSFSTTAAPPSADARLSVSDGDTITVRYIDVDDGLGGVNVPRDASAVADCAGPEITGVAAHDLLGDSARVFWDTDEPADSLVFYGTSPGSWLGSADPDLDMEHDVAINGLSECTDYVYGVQSADEAGNLTVDDYYGYYRSFTTGATITRFASADDTPLPIADHVSTYSVISIPETGAVVDVDVGLDIDHVYDADLDIFLKGPSGVEIELSTDNGGSGDDYSGTIFDDEAAISIKSGAPPYSGSFRPEGSLAAFDGISAAGDWILRVFDDQTGDTGTLLSWSLTITLPPGPCGPSAAYGAHALQADDCPPGGAGDADGIWDAGEELYLDVILKNQGTEPLNGIAATISALTPGVNLLHATETYGSLPPGGSAPPAAPFRIHLPDALACGAPVDFRLDITSDEGSWSGWFSQIAGEPIPPSETVLDEDFDSVGIPASWTIVNGGAGADTWFTDNAGDPGGCSSTDPNPPIAVNWAAVDSDCAGSVAMDESLLTPVLDLSDALGVTLEFDHYFNQDAMETAAVDARSSLTGGAWINIKSWTTDTANPVHEFLDLTSVGAGAADLQIRWHYGNADFAWYWYVDNVRVESATAGGCAMNVCATGSPPGEMAGAWWPDPAVFSWDPDPQASSGYTVYRGAGAELDGLSSATVDSCLRFTGAGPAANAVDLSADSPPPGDFYWYLVTGWNGSWEGPAGSGTEGPRIVNENGGCAP